MHLIKQLKFIVHSAMETTFDYNFLSLRICEYGFVDVARSRFASLLLIFIKYAD